MVAAADLCSAPRRGAQELHERAKAANLTFLNEVGLDPGWVLPPPLRAACLLRAVVRPLVPSPAPSVGLPPFSADVRWGRPVVLWAHATFLR
jgi:hypothetical protein